jgi:hypothetical protein
MRKASFSDMIRELIINKVYLSEMRKLSPLIFVFFLLVTVVTANAMTVANLYTVSLPAQSETSAVRNQLFAKALQEVFVKVSGSSKAISVPGIAAAISQAGNYVDQYSYKDKPVGQVSHRDLVVRFSPSAVRKVLRDNNQPIWGYNRPLVLAWVLLTNSQGQKLLGSGQQTNPILQQIYQKAGYRGLPIALPLLDLTDLQAISPQAILSDNVLAIETASQRYLPDAIMLVSLNDKSPQAITSTWSLIFHGAQQRWQVNGNQLDQVIKQGMNDVVDTMAKQYAILESTQSKQQVQLQVEGLHSIQAYAATLKYLRNLTGVSRVQPINTTDNKAVFGLTLSSSVPEIVQQIKLGRKLLPVLQYQGSTQLNLPNSQGLVYQYNSY